MNTIEIKERFGRRSKTAIEAIDYYRAYQRELALAKVTRIHSSKDINELLKPFFADLDVEHFYIVLLTRRNSVIEVFKLSEGGISGTVVDKRILLKKALTTPKCCSIICAHNHPSGNISPSHSDNQLTKEVKEACRIVDITLLDHIILTETDYYSYADEEKL